MMRNSIGGYYSSTGHVSPHHSLRKRNLSGTVLNGFDGGWGFDELTEQDFELMVPLFETSLLQGPDLLNALDSTVGESGSGFM